MSKPVERRAPAGDPAVVPGVYRFGSDRVNWYVVETDGELIVVDAGLPSHWQQLLDGLDDLGYSLEDISAVILTHGDGDHIGFADRLRETASVPVWVHESDVALAKGDADGNMGELLRNLWRPAVVGLVVEFMRNGGDPQPVDEVEPFEDGAVLDVPGVPQVIHVPGHSDGSCALYFPNHNVLLCGDALATLDIKTGRTRGPQLMSMFNVDREQAATSLDRIESLGQVTLLPGHGDPWRGEMSEAVRMAREQ